MRTILTILLVSLLFSSCNSSVKVSDLTYMEIVLDNGKQWTANAETTQGVKNMLVLSQEFSSDYQALHSNLVEEFQALFINCTMTGEAHNQLHNYLLPMVAMFDDISKAEASVSEPALEKLTIHLSAYSLFFN